MKASSFFHFLLRAVRLVCLLAPFTTQAQETERLTLELTDPGKPGTLHVNLVHGAIHVTGHIGKDVIVEVSGGQPAKRRPPGEPAPDGLRRLDRRPEVQAEEKGNRVTISASHPDQDLSLSIKVPQRFSLKLNTVNHGDIIVENVEGELEVSNVNGSIQLNQIAGSAVANTINGNLTATFRSVTPNTPMAFSTLNGKVDVSFPANLKASVKLKTDRGDLFTDFDLAATKSAPPRAEKTKGGATRVSLDNYTTGTINGGGPEILLKTMHGNIYLRRNK